MKGSPAGRRAGKLSEEMLDKFTGARAGRAWRVVLAAALVLFVALAVGSALTKIPGSDEAWFASPSLNLIEKGTMGTSVLEGITGIDRKTYWVMPLYLLTQAVWYKLVGFGILQMRASNALWGLLTLVSWLYVMRSLAEARAVAALAVVLLALDYFFVMGASFGRMDMMCAALGAAALAVYLRWRERNYTVAFAGAHALVAASGMTHYLGVLYFAGLLFLVLYLDRRRVRLRHVALATIPYAVGAVGWGLYVLQEPSTFAAQFGTNATMGGRLAGLRAPWRGLALEFTNRYLVAYGLGPHTAGHTGPIYLKAVVLAAYAVALAGALLTREIRAHRGYRILLILTAVFFLTLSVLDGQKLFYYLVHIIPLYTALLAVWIHRCWTRRTVPRALVALCVAGLLAVQVGGALYRIKLNTYGNGFLPAARFVRGAAGDGTLVMGSAILGVEMGFVENLVDDVRLGYYTGRRPGLVVVDEPYQQAFDSYRQSQPQYYEHIERTLAACRKVYDRAAITVYDCR